MNRGRGRLAGKRRHLSSVMTGSNGRDGTPRTRLVESVLSGSQGHSRRRVSMGADGTGSSRGRAQRHHSDSTRQGRCEQVWGTRVHHATTRAQWGQRHGRSDTPTPRPVESARQGSKGRSRRRGHLGSLRWIKGDEGRIDTSPSSGGRAWHCKMHRGAGAMASHTHSSAEQPQFITAKTEQPQPRQGVAGRRDRTRKASGRARKRSRPLACAHRAQHGDERQARGRGTNGTRTRDRRRYRRTSPRKRARANRPIAATWREERHRRIQAGGRRNCTRNSNAVVT
mmetsp:Transcript_30243/g.62287  ORF Transcript_30243/g.62287 Transcript_30243/m.62287 type:complete len:283 (+) Transcript_30243:173-1021(+)